MWVNTQKLWPRDSQDISKKKAKIFKVEETSHRPSSECIKEPWKISKA